jgi:hypothetical protein
MSITRKWLEVAAPLENEMFEIKYQAEPGYFDTYLPVVKRMFDSFQIMRDDSMR